MNRKQLVDVAERSLATFAQAFLAMATLDNTGILHLTSLHVVEAAALAGGYSVAKYLLVQANQYLNTPAK